MIGSIALVIRCGRNPRLLLQTLKSVDLQRSLIREGIVVRDPSTPAGATGWIEGVAAAREYVVVACESSRPASIWNTGCSNTSADIIVCLDSGDRLLAGAVETVLRAFDEDRLDVLLGSAIRRSAEQTIASGPVGTDSLAIACHPEHVHAFMPIRRRALTEIGGFDEFLPTYVPADAAIRVLAHGGVVGSTHTPLVMLSEVELEPVEGGWEPFLERHITSLRQDPATALRVLEDELRQLSIPYERLRGQRESATDEIGTLRARRDALRTQLSLPGVLDLGDLARTTPWSRDWGYDRGTPVDRYFIERFLDAHRGDIQGRVLEIQESDYTRRFGGAAVSRSDVVDIDASNPHATVIADLREAPNLQSESYDCVIITQTLHVIADMKAVIDECARILKPGGVMLATLPCSSRVCLEYGPDGDFWRVTEAGARRLFEETFGPECVEALAHGNVLTNAAFQYGLGLRELDSRALEQDDPFNPMIVVVRATKAGPKAPVRHATRRLEQNTGVVLLYHRVAAAPSDVHGLCVLPAHFREQMAYLKDTCTVLPLHELCDAAAGGRMPPRAVAITFDDAYLDVLEEAAPTLLRHGIPATVFATTAPPLDTPAFHYWWDILEWAVLSATSADSLTVWLDDGARTFPMGTTTARRAAHHAIHNVMVPLDARRREDILEQLLAGRDPHRQRLPRRLSAIELRALGAQSGFTIGAHGHDHLALPAHPVEQQRLEIVESRMRLEALLEREVRTFAYPFGAWSRSTAEIARAAGMRLALTCEEGPIRDGVDPLACPRVGVPPSTPEGFVALVERTLAPGYEKRLAED